MTSRRLYIYAPNLHQGGGKTLLETLVFSDFSECEVVVISDFRMSFSKEVRGECLIKKFAPTVLGRLKAELWLRGQVEPKDIVLCLSSLPPLFRLPAHTIVFVQNRYLLKEGELTVFPRRVQLRITLERIWLRSMARHADSFIVQTSSMRNGILALDFAAKEQVAMVPFSERMLGNNISIGQQFEKMAVNLDADFLYVASGEPHKNHRRLIDAWEILAREGVFPSLSLTLDPALNVELLQWIANRVELHGLKINNLGVLDKPKLLKLYKSSTAMIYPSLFESFGLPLVEAREVGVPILASELDYVRDLLDPVQSFDPDSAISIARAVKRFVGYPEAPLKILTGSEFLKYIWQEGQARCES